MQGQWLGQFQATQIAGPITVDVDELPHGFGGRVRCVDTCCYDLLFTIMTVFGSTVAVNAGFVRIYDAAWSGDNPGPAVDSDREPAGISLAQVAEVDVFNATTCRAWREIALGMREYYTRLQSATNVTMQ